MRFKKYRMSALNEALLGSGIVEPKEEVGYTAAVDPAFADAIDSHKVRKERIEAECKEAEKAQKEFVKMNHNRNVKGQTTKEMKAMKLAEEKLTVSPAIEAENIEVKDTQTNTEPLTEAVDFGDPTAMGRSACAPLAPDFTRSIRDYVKHLNDSDSRDFCMRSLKKFAESLYGAMGEQQAFNSYWTARYPAVMKYIEDQLAMIPSEVLDDAQMPSVHEEIEQPRKKRMLGKVGGWISSNRSGLFYSRTPESSGVQISEENYDYIKDNFELSDRQEISTPWGIEVKRQIIGKKNVAESVHDDDDIEGLDEFLDINATLDASGQSVGLLGGTGGTVNNEELDETLLDIGGINITANGNNVPFMNGMTGLGEDTEKDPHFFAVELNESPVDTAEPKTRTRGENEVKYQRDYSSEDLWLAVYDELSSEVDNEGSGQQVDKQIKAKRGERYENVYPHGDSDIIIYATKPEEFEFAKRVADHYGVKYREPKEDTNPATNGHYKWSMVIEIPEDELFDAAFKPLHKDDEF